MKRGRKLKLTKELIDAVCQLVKKGVPAKYICSMLRIGETTFYRWLEQGQRDEKGIYREFWESIQSARGEFIQTAIDNMKLVGYDDWKMWSWLLERLYPSDFRPNIQVEAKEEINAKMDMEGNILKKVVSDEEATELVHRLLEKFSQDKPGISGE